MARIIIPTPLRKFTGNQGQVEVSSGKLIDAVNELIAKHPELGRYLLDGNDKLQGFVKVFLGDEDIEHLEGTQTAVSEDATISIIPAIAGGKC